MKSCEGGRCTEFDGRVDVSLNFARSSIPMESIDGDHHDVREGGGKKEFAF